MIRLMYTLWIYSANDELVMDVEVDIVCTYHVHTCRVESTHGYGLCIMHRYSSLLSNGFIIHFFLIFY
jgi:hypothetical protein